MVASATSTNGVVQGLAQEEKLIVAVKAVASSTAQLHVTCQVKADARSENNRYILTQYQMLINRISQLDYDWEGDVPSTCPMVHRQSTYPRIILSTFIQVAIHTLVEYLWITAGIS